MGPEEEFEEFTSNGTWADVYRAIKQEAILNHDFSLKDARRPEFRGRNRYRDVSPYDHSRVKLERDSIDYINANLIEAPTAHRSYILTQGPLPNTSGHFWLMVWEQNSKAVLMLNRVIEKGQLKCHQYFPTGEEDEEEEEFTFADVDIKVSYKSEENANYYTVRTLELTDLRSGQTKQVLQFHYTTWPDFGVPQSPAAFLNFLMAVRKSGALENDVGPPVIHCSAGIGRSGTFCLVDTCLVIVNQTRDLQSLNIRKVLMDMRRYRMGLIQTADQLRFSYMAIIEGAKSILCGSPDSGYGGSPTELPPNVPKLENGDTHKKIPHRDDSDDTDEIPPPLPPRKKPRQEEMNNHNNPGGSDNPHAEEEDSTLRRRESAEVRRRNREERIKNTSAQLQKMKEKQKASENWQARKSALKPYMAGLAAAVLIGGVFFYRYYFM